MKIELSQHIVAFIDILGFSNMVKHDCEKPQSSEKYADKLYFAYNRAKEIKKHNPDLNVTQFSDSIVISLPYSEVNLHQVIKITSDYQYELLKNNLFCRGGISYGKHFIKDDFLFSMGLIDAYQIEQSKANNPRVIVSKELLELITKDTSNKLKNSCIIQESDGEYFVDYLKGRDINITENVIEQIRKEFDKQNSSVRAKYEWLINYFTFSFPESSIQDVPKWIRVHIPN